MKDLKNKFVATLAKQETKAKMKDAKRHDRNRKAFYKDCVKRIRRGVRNMHYDPFEINEQDLEYVIHLLHLDGFTIALCNEGRDEFYVYPQDCKVEGFGNSNYYVYINDQRYVMFGIDEFR